MFLLFRPSGSDNRFPASTFTFHYVSIISHSTNTPKKRKRYLHSIMFLLFRFGIFQHADYFIYLHSIIFLLFRRFRLIPAFHQLNLHSIMFLLFRRRNRSDSRSGSFTFHYVSIISRPVIRYKIAVFSFTFHYVSIISLLLLHGKEL